MAASTTAASWSTNPFARQRGRRLLQASTAVLVAMQDYHVYQKIGSGKHSVRGGRNKERDVPGVVD